MKNWKLIDVYETEIGEELGYCETWDECKTITEERCNDTSDECSVYAIPLDEATGKYNRSKATLVRI